MVITKDRFLSKRPRKTRIVNVDDLGGDVVISVLTAREKEDFESWVTTNKANTSGANIRARLVCLSVVDEAGNRMFDERDLDALGNIDSHVIEHLFNEILELNAFTKKDAEALLKNSNAPQDAASS